jgi:hypothetical protein
MERTRGPDRARNKVSRAAGAWGALGGPCAGRTNQPQRTNCYSTGAANVIEIKENRLKRDHCRSLAMFAAIRRASSGAVNCPAVAW